MIHVTHVYNINHASFWLTKSHSGGYKMSLPNGTHSHRTKTEKIRQFTRTAYTEVINIKISWYIHCDISWYVFESARRTHSQCFRFSIILCLWIQCEFCERLSFAKSWFSFLRLLHCVTVWRADETNIFWRSRINATNNSNYRLWKVLFFFLLAQLIVLWEYTKMLYDEMSIANDCLLFSSTICL